jgi:ribose transport system permease protein
MKRTSPVRRLSASIGEARFAALFFIVLLIINVLLSPARFRPSELGILLGLAAPVIYASIAATPPILSGRGGIDVSVGPFMGLVNVLIVQGVITNLGLTDPWTVIPIALGFGLLSGLLNGLLAAVIRIPPIVATLGTYLIYSGLTTYIMPAPSGDVPQWLAALSEEASFVPLALLFLFWWGVRRLPFYEQLMATGGDDRAAYASGVNVTAVRVGAYILGGLFASVGGLSLTALLGSGDPTVGAPYTLTAIAGAALGGVSLAGGRGGLFGAMLGAIDIFLLQNILTFLNVTSFVLQMAYGFVLVVAVILNSEVIQRRLGELFGGRDETA